MHTLSKNDKSNENTFFSSERGELVLLSNNSAALFFLPSRLGNLDTNLFFCGCHKKLTLSNPTIAGLLRFLRFCLHWTLFVLLGFLFETLFFLLVCFGCLNPQTIVGIGSGDAVHTRNRESAVSRRWKFWCFFTATRFGFLLLFYRLLLPSYLAVFVVVVVVAVHCELERFLN